MVYKILVSVFLFQTSGQSSDNGYHEENRRIRVGDLSPVFPFFVHLSITKPKGYSLCGACLLTPNGAVTAAHCLETATAIEAYFGSKKLMDGLKRNAQNWQLHPKYHTESKAYDIGVIAWKEKISWSKDIAPITIGSLPKPGTKATVIGFGHTGTKEYTSSLRRATVTIADNDTCKKKTPHWKIFFDNSPTETYLCSIDTPYKGTCDGDSGGPLFLEGAKPALIGIISLGPHPCREGAAFYASAVFHSKWIKGTIKCLQNNEPKNCVIL